MLRKKRGQYYQAVKIPVRIIETEKRSSFRIAISLALVLILILSQTGIFSAFEAHIISVTATIDNGIADYLVINKVYYDVDSQHGSEPDNEWIELYNPTEEAIDINNWQICDNNSCDDIIFSGSIPAKGFAIITDKDTTWNYWNIPAEVIKIALDNPIGDGLDNDVDMLILKDPDGNIVDQMNWGIPDAIDVAEGNMLGRSPNGFDTNRPSDWKEFSIPVVIVIIPNGFEIWWVGHTYTLEWIASSYVGDDSNLSIDIWYSKDSGETWANIVMGTENDGQYDWRIPLFINGYYVPSDQARIKVVATDITTNFMITGWDMSDNNFCPPIDFDLLTPEELAMFEAMFGNTGASGGNIVPEEITPVEPTEEPTEEPEEEEPAEEEPAEEVPIEQPAEEPIEEPIEEPTPAEEPVDEVIPVTTEETEEIPSGTEKPEPQPEPEPEPEPIIEEEPVLLPETAIPEEAIVPEEAPVLEPSAPGPDPSSGDANSPE